MHVELKVHVIRRRPTIDLICSNKDRFFGQSENLFEDAIMNALLFLSQCTVTNSIFPSGNVSRHFPRKDPGFAS